MDEPAAPHDAPTRGPGPTHGGGRTRTWIVVVLVAVALAVGALTAALLVGDPAAIHDGTGTATFAWVSTPVGYSTTTVAPRPQPFTGRIEGHPVAGTSTLVIPGGALPTGATTPVFRYRGTFAGSSFDVTVSFAYPALPAPGDIATARSAQYIPRVTITGTYGTSSVHGEVIPVVRGSSPAAGSRLVGTIGTHAVVGTFSPVTGTGGHQHVSASFGVRG